MVCPLTRVRTLERKLEAKMLKEESDYHDLESVVQQAEQNLELMTVRGAGATRAGVGLCPRSGPEPRLVGTAVRRAHHSGSHRGRARLLAGAGQGPMARAGGPGWRRRVLCPRQCVNDAFFSVTETGCKGRKSRHETQTRNELASGN